MDHIQIFWTPEGVNLDQIGDKRFLEVTDGDTPTIRMDVRMLSIDTPEKNKTNTEISNVAELEVLFAKLVTWIQSGEAPVLPQLAAHLLPRLQRPTPVANHVQQGKLATEEHKRIVEQKLTRPSGSKRNLFVRIADRPFERYGRLLAYVAPDYTAAERAHMTRRERATFNFFMAESGWAATFILYPNIPGELDLPMFREAAKAAFEGRKGAWADPLGLTGYEFRALERLAAVKKKLDAGGEVKASARWAWVERYVADMTTKELFGPQGYHQVKPYDRLFIDRNDVRRCVADLGLTPAPADRFGSPLEV
jgi:endonuclease YncB( thermonuclease family)